MVERMTSFNGYISKILLWIGGAGLFTMTLIIGWQVYARYVLNDSPSWSEQLSLLLMIWYALLAAAAGFHEGFHIKIIALQTAATEKRARVMRIMAEVIVVLCGAMMVIWGLELANIISGHIIPSLGISRAWAYAPLPIAGALIVLFSGTRLAGEILHPGFTKEDEIEASVPPVGDA